MFIKSYKKRLIVFLAVCFTVIAVSYITTVASVPGRITLLEGEEYVYNFKSPFMVYIKADRDGVIKLNDGDIKANGSYFSLSNPISLKTQKHGMVNLKVLAFGLIPLKIMQVDVVPNKKVVACGNTIGVKLRLDGILVIGMSDVETIDGKKTLPIKESGIKPGDLITEVNNVKLSSIEDLIKEIDKSKGEKIRLRYRHGSIYNYVEVKPVKAIDDKKYHIGLWVRDSTAGIGTLTFYDPETKFFGALGHGITDIDTGTLMPVEDGEILESNILAVKKGQQGNPGELKGVFIEDRNKLGVIKKNCEYGIYGVLNQDSASRISDRLYPIALRMQIKEGPAAILANIDGKTVGEYSVDIQKVSKQNISGSKGMVIKITDQRLLEITGGIVQGMSGSPVIQDGRIIGAVTHVLISDPTRGYGIFIENMLKNTMVGSQQMLDKAS